jgi:hypothetical protein
MFNYENSPIERVIAKISDVRRILVSDQRIFSLQRWLWANGTKKTLNARMNGRRLLFWVFVCSFAHLPGALGGEKGNEKRQLVGLICAARCQANHTFLGQTRLMGREEGKKCFFVLTISIFTISRLHLNWVMHLKQTREKG